LLYASLYCLCFNMSVSVCDPQLSLLPVPCICFQDGNTIFHDATLNGQVDVMKCLVEFGAKCDEKDNVSESVFVSIYINCFYALHFCFMAFSWEQLHFILLLSEGVLMP
jgi:hypothetical protein